MPRYLITGRAGSGKSSIADELRRRGYVAYDTDSIPGLSSWVVRSTGKKVSIVDNTSVDLNTYDWLWDGDILRHYVSGKDTLFICGGADNDFDFEPLFTRHFALSLSPDMQTQRLVERTSNDYGKDPAMHGTILAKQAAHITNARSHGAVIIDASQPIELVVDEILRHTK